jgi:hypothetical protein
MLASMLSEYNLGLLDADDDHEYFIATTEEDYNAVRYNKIMPKLSEHCLINYIGIDQPEPGYNNSIHHQDLCFRKLLNKSRNYNSNAYGCLTWPDIIMSDGYVMTMIREANNGAQLMLRGSTRQTKECIPWLRHEHDPLRFAELNCMFLHPEMFQFVDDYPNRSSRPPFRLWRFTGGLIYHTLMSDPVMIDYSAVKPDHAERSDPNKTFEEEYIDRNFGAQTRVYVVRNPMDFCSVSISAPRDTDPPNLPPAKPSWWRDWTGMMEMRREYMRRTNNGRSVVRANLFKTRIWWNNPQFTVHYGEAARDWTLECVRIQSQVDFAVGDSWASRMFVGLPSQFVPARDYLRELFKRLWLVLCGNKEMRRWAIRQTRLRLGL